MTSFHKTEARVLSEPLSAVSDTLTFLCHQTKLLQMQTQTLLNLIADFAPPAFPLRQLDLAMMQQIWR